MTCWLVSSTSSKILFLSLESSSTSFIINFGKIVKLTPSVLRDLYSKRAQAFRLIYIPMSFFPDFGGELTIDGGLIYNNFRSLSGFNDSEKYSSHFRILEINEIHESVLGLV
ncbi:hypothetical protein BpHYR1_038311 [Brachionus plicatilis]|uniref:PNPLA domain-containing protein n=1 Tax=Brachionus plicatilis TaxID=10195 RepID=A0A3M7RYM1_BRAPC|nr:hypothetical protein BpHYR1_038311 [Brachionus plicatilis]